jgi:hypothetical protein
MNVDLAALADYASETRDGKLIAAGIFDRIAPPTIPWQHPTMYIALRLHVHPGEEGTHALRIRLVDPDGNELMSMDGDTTIGEIDPVEGTTVQLVLGLNNVVFNTAGRHGFDLFIDGRYEHSLSLTVAEAPAPTEPPLAQ